MRPNTLQEKFLNDAKKFQEQLRHIGQNLPIITDWENFKENFFCDKATPYVDAIELMDFYVEEVARQWQKLT